MGCHLSAADWNDTVGKREISFDLCRKFWSSRRDLTGKTIFFDFSNFGCFNRFTDSVIAKKIPGRFLPWMVGVVAAGGIGNLIDRIFRGFVVDYLDFCWIHYPVFNFADCCVVVGIFVIAGYVFWNEKKQGKVEIQPPKGKEK